MFVKNELETRQLLLALLKPAVDVALEQGVSLGDLKRWAIPDLREIKGIYEELWCCVTELEKERRARPGCALEDGLAVTGVPAVIKEKENDDE